MDKDDEKAQYLGPLLVSMAKVAIDGNLSRFTLDTTPGNFFCPRTILIRKIKEGLPRLFCIRLSPKMEEQVMNPGSLGLAPTLLTTKPSPCFNSHES